MDLITIKDETAILDRETATKIAEEQGKTLDEETVKNWTMKQASDFISKYKGVK